ncbi:MAG: HlyD family efflux transporter periplasmic adaptor subunit [Pseudomonadota bacterium]
MRQTSCVGLLLLLLLGGCERSPQRALGTLEWDRMNGRAIASEVVTELLVQEGDAVVAGQPLLRLDARLQEASVMQTQAQIEQIQAELRELRTGFREEQVAAARARYEASVSARENAELEYERQKKLEKDQLTSERNLDLARTRLDETIGREESDFERLKELKAGFRVERIQQTEARLRAAEAELDYQETLLLHYTVVAERDGVLESFPFKLGDKPPAGAVVTTVLAGEGPWARVYLPELWMSSVRVGTEVDVYVDGRDLPVEGRVRHIESRPTFTPYYALAEEDRQRLTYVTEIDLAGGEARELAVGIPVQVALKGQ